MVSTTDKFDQHLTIRLRTMDVENLRSLARALDRGVASTVRLILRRAMERGATAAGEIREGANDAR